MDGTAVSVLRMISYAGYIVAALFCIISIILFFRFRIPVIAGDLSGRTARKQIKAMREKNALVKGSNSYIPGEFNGAKRITQQIKKSEKLTRTQRMKEENTYNTSVLDITEDMGTTILANDFSSGTALPESGTTVLNDSDPHFEITRNIVIIHTNEKI